MSAKYRKIDPRIWRDEGFCSLSENEKLVAFYLLTSHQCNRIGLFGFSPAMAAEELETLPQTFRERFEKVCQTFHWAYDSKAKVLYIGTWWKYNRPENPNVFKACLEDLHDLPKTHLISEFCANIKFLPEGCVKVLGNVSAYVTTNVPPNVTPNQEQEQEQYQEQEQDAKAAPVAGRKEKPAGLPSAEDAGYVRRYRGGKRIDGGSDEAEAWKRDISKTVWILRLWNELASNLPKCHSKWNEDMHNGAMFILNEYADGDEEKFRNLIEYSINHLENSERSNGQGNLEWRATVTWMLKPKNYEKILACDYGTFDLEAAMSPHQPDPPKEKKVVKYIHPKTGEIVERICEASS